MFVCYGLFHKHTVKDEHFVGHYVICTVCIYDCEFNLSANIDLLVNGKFRGLVNVAACR